MKKVFTIVLIAFISGIISIYGQQQGEAGPDFEVELLDGSTFILSEQGGKVVLVFLFGNTCPSCLGAGPSVEAEIYQEFKENENFTAIGLDTWNNTSNNNSVSGFQSTTGITFPLALKAGSVASAYETTYDRLMVIDQEGVLVHKGKIGASNDISNAVHAIMESLTVAASGEHPEESLLNLYPNPVSDRLYINSRKRISGINFYDMSGKLVERFDYPDGTGSSGTSINLEHFVEGIYFYSIETSGSVRTGKLVIQR